MMFVTVNTKQVFDTEFAWPIPPPRRYNPTLGVVFYSPLAGFSLLALRGFLITYDAPQSVGLLWTNDQSVAETSDNTQHSQQTNIHAPGGIRTHNLSR